MIWEYYTELRERERDDDPETDNHKNWKTKEGKLCVGYPPLFLRTGETLYDPKKHWQLHHCEEIAKIAQLRFSEFYKQREKMDES